MARERRGPSGGDGILNRHPPQDGRFQRPALDRRAAAASGRAPAGRAVRTRGDGDGAARERGGTPHDAAAAAPAAPDRDDLADALERDAGARLDAAAEGTLRPVVNATGVVIHTNLGRAPLAERRAGPRRRRRPRLFDARVRPGRPAGAARARCTPSGCSPRSPAPRRRSSSTTTPPRCCWRWRRWPSGREVVVSRGELVEIGGGFRVPDVLAQSGASLREVGTTNRTRLADYHRRHRSGHRAVAARAPARTSASRASPNARRWRRWSPPRTPPASPWSRTSARAMSTPRARLGADRAGLGGRRRRRRLRQRRQAARRAAGRADHRPRRARSIGCAATR